MPFAHLHVHTSYSLLDGAAPPDKLIQRAKQLGYEQIAITDHGNMYAVFEFYTKCIENGIKPIIGCEVYTAPRMRYDKDRNLDSDYGHLVLLCQNNEGYRNLMKIVTVAQTEGMYYKPRVDIETLKKYHNGLIALSACLRGDVPKAYLTGGFQQALKKAREFEQIFGRGNFYLEIQDHGMDDEKKVSAALVRLSRETGIPLVATNDVHYINKDDAFLQDVLTCIQTGKNINDEDRLKFFGEEFYLKSEQQMAELFYYAPEAILNTYDIAKRCSVTIDTSQRHVPKIEIKGETNHIDYLKRLCRSGLKSRYGIVTDELKSRLDYELEVIEKMGFADYFLIVYDFVKFAKDNNIFVGPGRGSAAGSLVAYSLNITEIDPIKYGLIFERFLNPERVSMPDIDIDFCYERRDEVRAYVTKKYGADKVAQIITFGTLAARAAVRCVGKALGVNSFTVDKTARAVPEVLHIKLADALAGDKQLKSMYETDYDVKRIIDTAIKLEGFPRNVSTHAAGVIIADAPLNNYTPLQPSDTGLITQYPMDALEKEGLLKMDFLALRNLTVIRDTLKLIKMSNKDGIRQLSDINYSDGKTFDMISRGDTDGVFQLENPGLQSFLRKFKPKSLDDIIITTSIYRPGPMAQIPEFLKNVSNPQNIRYIHPLLKQVTEPTFGAIVYQEQVMEIVRIMAGYSMARADMVRKVMAKKKPELMQKEREVFVNGLTDGDGNVVVPGAVRMGISEKEANEVFDYLASFAQYAFNKSHAACYATLAYQTAYLKCHYPSEYLVALLMSLMGNSYKINKYIKSFSKYGIRLLPPDVNKSRALFSVDGKDVRFGLAALKGVGLKFPNDIETERAQGKFKSFADFLNRMADYGINRRCCETLIKCGAFDSLNKNRRALLLVYDVMLDCALQDAKLISGGQQSLFDAVGEQSGATDSMINEKQTDFTREQKLAFEKEYAGMYLSGHPLEKYRHIVKAYTTDDIYTILDGKNNDGLKVRLCGIISSPEQRRTKSGKMMAVMTLSDFYADIELTVFENTYYKYEYVIQNTSAVMVEATVNVRGENTVSLTAKSITPLESLHISPKFTLYVRIENSKKLDFLLNITQKYRGNNGLCIYFADTQKAIKADDKNSVCICSQIIYELCELFGDENVKIK